jgi:hypothetical protein
MRLRARTDANQASIVKALRDMGVSIVCLHQIGKGCGDILAGWQNRNYLFEIKAPGGRLTHDESEFLASWNGQASVIHSAEEAVDIMLEDDEEEN